MAALVIVGFLLRLGVPIAVTALLAWLLHRLDARWEAEAQVERARIEKLIAAGAPCWEINNCPEAGWRVCPAHTQPSTPCWEHKRDQAGNLLRDCIGCSIFRVRAPALVTI